MPAKEIEAYVTEYTLKLLKSPVAVYEHQKKLQSTKAEFNKLERKCNEIAEALNARVAMKERYKEQHAGGLIEYVPLEQKIKEINESEAKLRLELDKLSEQKSRSVLSTSYVSTLELFSKKYSELISKAPNDKKLLYDVFHRLYDEIVVYSRPLEEGDKVAGKKRDSQKIPYRIHLKLRLPKEILREVGLQDLGDSVQKTFNGGR